MSGMRSVLFAVAVVAVACVAGLADSNRNWDRNVGPVPILDRKTPPPVTLPEALRIAEEYVRTDKIDVSHRYIYSAVLAAFDGKDYWYVKWLPTDPFSSPEGEGFRRKTPAWFTLRIDMEKNVKHFAG